MSVSVLVESMPMMTRLLLVSLLLTTACASTPDGDDDSAEPIDPPAEVRAGVVTLDNLSAHPGTSAGPEGGRHFSQHTATVARSRDGH